MGFRIAPPFTWGDYPAEWIYAYFGTDPNISWGAAEFGIGSECLAIGDTAPCLDGHRPVAIQLASDGTTLTLLVSTNGVTFTPVTGGSWAIANLPGGLGDVSAQAMSAEIKVIANISTLCKVAWTAPTVPKLNGAGSMCVYGPRTAVEQTYDDLYFSFMNENDIFTEAGHGPDHNWNTIPDDYEVALLAKAMTENPDVQAAYDANLAVADTWNAGNVPPWGSGRYEEVAAAYATMGTEGMTAVNWLLYIFADGFAAYENGKTLTEPLSAEGDYDGDGHSNLDEYNYVVAQGGSIMDYVSAAAGGSFGPGMPVGSLVGLGMLLTACAAAGVAAARKK
jgi:hypothetical protein